MPRWMIYALLIGIAVLYTLTLPFWPSIPRCGYFVYGREGGATHCIEPIRRAP